MTVPFDPSMFAGGPDANAAGNAPMPGSMEQLGVDFEFAGSDTLEIGIKLVRVLQLGFLEAIL